MASRPTVFPFIDRSASNILDWAASPLQFTGYQPGSVIPSAAHNTTGLLGALWGCYLDYGTVRNSDALAPVTQRWSTTQLAYTLGGNVTGAGGTIDTWATYFVGGYRIEIDDGLLRIVGASPLIQPSATLPGRIWLYLDHGIITDPAQPFASVRVELAGVGAAANPGAGELPLVGVDVNALGVITGNSYDPSDPAIGLSYRAALPQTFRGAVGIDGAADLNSTLDVSGAVNLTSTLDVLGATVLGSNLDVVSDAVFGANVEIGGNLNMDGGAVSNVDSLVASGAGVTIDATTSSATAAAVFGTNSNTGPGIRGVGTSNSGVQGATAGSSAGVAGTNSGAGPGVKGTGGTAAAGVEGVASVAAQPGVLGTGFAGAASHGVAGVAVNTASYGVHGSASAAATTSGAGVRADGLGDAPAVLAVAVNGNAGHFTTDTSSPTRSPVVIVPVDSDPSTTQVGSLYPNSSRLNKLRHHDGSVYLSVHSSSNGRVFATAMAVDQIGLAGATGELCRSTITPEVVGNVLLTMTGFYTPSGDTDTLTVIIRDDTAGVNLVTRVVRAKDVDASGARGEGVVVRYLYTLPSAVAGREFVIVLQTSAAGDINNPILSVEGVF